MWVPGGRSQVKMNRRPSAGPLPNPSSQPSDAEQIAIDSSATSVLVTGLANNIYYTCTLRARAWQANTLLAPVSQSNVSAASTAFMPTGTSFMVEHCIRRVALMIRIYNVWNTSH